MTQSASPIFDLLEGRTTEHVSSFEGTGQYTQGGTSTCGLAALNAVRIVLGREKAGVSGLRLLEQIISKDVIEEIVAICARWASQLHLEVDDIATLPLFESPLALSFSEYNEAEPENFMALLRRLQETSETSRSSPSSAAVVITRPPEIFTVFYIPTHIPKRPGIFAVFDSHPRPDKGARGASFILFPTLEDASRYISGLLQVDTSLLSEAVQWQAQLLGHYSGHAFLARNSYDVDTDHMKSMYDANMEILELKSRLAEAEERNQALTGANSDLRERIARFEDTRSIERISLKGKSSLGKSYRASAPVPGPSTRREASLKNPSRALPHIPSHDDCQISSSGEFEHDLGVAHQLNRKLEEEDRESWEAARGIQEQLDQEDSELRSQMGHLKQMAQVQFTCVICFDTHPEDSVARLDTCRHELCRECMTNFVTLKLEEHRYPILCPICHLDKGVEEPGQITGDLVEQLGLTAVQQAIWLELELSQFSIVLDCPKCRRSAFVDINDHADMKILMCPLAGCKHVWCKECQRHVEQGTQHSCDGTLELEDLMKSRGWQHCPGCKTPTEKQSGCNHMTCPGRGCNTHFCYICGESIVRSVRRGDIEPALSAHYRRCRLFEG